MEEQEKSSQEDVTITNLAGQRTSLAYLRTRLANQRTYLAWLRTGMASVCGGVIILKWPLFQYAFSQWITKGFGVLLVLLGVIIFAFSYKEHKNMASLLGDEKERQTLDFILWMIALVLAAGSLTYLLMILYETVM